MTINRVFASEGFRKKKSGSVKYRFFLLDTDPDLVARFGRGRTYQCQGIDTWVKVFAHATRKSAWISSTTEKTEALLKAASIFLAHRPSCYIPTQPRSSSLLRRVALALPCLAERCF